MRKMTMSMWFYVVHSNQCCIVRDSFWLCLCHVPHKISMRKMTMSMWFYVVHSNQCCIVRDSFWLCLCHVPHKMSCTTYSDYVVLCHVPHTLTMWYYVMYHIFWLCLCHVLCGTWHRFHVVQNGHVLPLNVPHEIVRDSFSLYSSWLFLTMSMSCTT